MLEQEAKNRSDESLKIKTKRAAGRVTDKTGGKTMSFFKTSQEAQNAVNNALERFGRIGAGLFDALDDAGFYAVEDGKGGYTVKRK